MSAEEVSEHKSERASVTEMMHGGGGREIGWSIRRGEHQEEPKIATYAEAVT